MHHAREAKLRPRHYPLITELNKEEEQVLNGQAMSRRSIAVSLLQEYQTLPLQPRLVPSADGALKALALTIPAYAMAGEDNPYWKVYTDLILKLPSYTRFFILAHASVRESVQEWVQEQALEHRVQLATVPDAIEMTVWAEDDFELVHDPDGVPYMVQPHSNRRAGDELASYYAARQFGWQRVKVPVYFEGGNVLVGDDFFLLGANYGVDTFLDLRYMLQGEGNHLKKKLTELYQQYLDRDRILYLICTTLQLPAEQERLIKLNGEDWKEILYARNTEGTVQPIFHIDMFLTLAGRNAQGKYHVLVGDPRVASRMLGNNFDDLATPEAFDEIAELLERLKFEVIRNPLPLVYVDDAQEKVRKWYYASYNNALVEVNSQEEKTVWLPTYGHGNWQELQQVDQRNKEIWEGLGFTVILLEDYHPLAEFAGSVHCITKYVERE